MCFTSKIGKVRVATENIKCYKVLEKTEDGLRSWLWGFKYESNVLQPEVGLTVHKHADFFKVDEGYHSLATKSGFMLARYYHFSTSPVVVKCVIPKGAKYLHDKDKGEYVSSSIIIQRVVR